MWALLWIDVAMFGQTVGKIPAGVGWRGLVLDIVGYCGLVWAIVGWCGRYFARIVKSLVILTEECLTSPGS